MSKSFRIIVSLISILLGCFFLIEAPFVLMQYSLGAGILFFASWPFLVVLVLFFLYCCYKVIRGYVGFYFCFLNGFGVLGLILFVFLGSR